MKCKETNIQNISLRSFGRCQVFFSVCVVRVEIFELYKVAKHLLLYKFVEVDQFDCNLDLSLVTIDHSYSSLRVYRLRCQRQCRHAQDVCIRIVDNRATSGKLRKSRSNIHSLIVNCNGNR